MTPKMRSAIWVGLARPTHNATQPSDGVRATNGAGEPVSDFDEEPITGVVSERIVHNLEPVEVEEQHAHSVLARGSLHESLAHTIEQQCAIGKSCEPVVQCVVAQRALELGTFGDVMKVDDDAPDAGVVQQVRHRGFEVTHTAIAVPGAKCERHRSASIREHALKCGVEDQKFVALHERKERR